MDIEAVILTGGASRRMGADKATIMVDGVPQADRLVSMLGTAGHPVSVLGPKPVPGATLVLDDVPFAGPAHALSRFRSRAPLVLVLQCDLVCFDVRLVALMAGLIGSRDAVVPVLDGIPQPLCALYTRSALSGLAERVAQGDKKMMAWLEQLSWLPLHAIELQRAGLDPWCVRGANTPTELRALLEQRTE